MTPWTIFFNRLESLLMQVTCSCLLTPLAIDLKQK